MPSIRGDGQDLVLVAIESKDIEAELPSSAEGWREAPGVVLIKRLIFLNQPPRRLSLDGAPRLDQGGEFGGSDFM